MACQGPCNCCAPTRPARAPLRAEPAPLPDISFTFTQLPPGSTPTVVITGVPPVYNVAVGFPGAFSPVFGTNVAVNMIPNGDPASGTIDNTDPLNPTLTLNIPSPLDGEDGMSRFAALSSSFIQPAIGGLVTVTVTDTEWMSIGDWVYVSGGGWYVVASNPLSATQIILRNPGNADLTPIWGTPPAGSPWFGAWSVALNANPGTTITPNGFSNQVAESGIPGPRGPQGDGGLTPQVRVVYTVPVSAPVSEAENLVLYFNAAPPSVPTIGRFYEWDGASWIGGPNFVGVGGTNTFSGTPDPNIVPPVGAKLLDIYIQTGTSAITYYRLTSPTVWTPFGVFSLLGTATTDVNWTSGPGTYAIDLATFSYNIEADKDIELDWDDTNYNGQGAWTVLINNIDASPIDLTFATGKWSADPALSITPPVAIASGNIVVMQFVKGKTGISYCITNLFIPAGI